MPLEPLDASASEISLDKVLLDLWRPTCEHTCRQCKMPPVYLEAHPANAHPCQCRWTFILSSAIVTDNNMYVLLFIIKDTHDRLTDHVKAHFPRKTEIAEIYLGSKLIFLTP